MRRIERRFGILELVVTGLVLAGVAGADDFFAGVDEDDASFHATHTPFDRSAEPGIDPAESQFLVEIFSLADEAARLNANVVRWFLAGGRAGLHPVDYLEEMGELRATLERRPTPARLESIRAAILESMALQREFFRDWFSAIEADEPFESQLTGEFAYHEGLHRSHRMLLKAFVELHALFPEAENKSRMAFRDHLAAMDLL